MATAVEKLKRLQRLGGVFALALALSPASLHAQATDDATQVAAEDTASAVPQEQSVELTAAQLFQFAEEAKARGEFTVAEAAYLALIQDPEPELKTEARFRLAMLYADQMGKPRDAAVLLRRILDEKPDVARVRVELARVQAMMGNFSEAQRELRAAEAAGLPPEVESLVRFFANALSAQKRFGGGVEAGFAPTTNVNRATSSDTLGTVIGDFVLDEDAQAQSGIGLSLKGQAYYRLPISRTADILLRASGSADVYEKSRFNDYAFSIQAGPQWRSGADRFSLSAALSWRWYGGNPYTFTYGLSGNWQHPLGKRTQLRVDGTVLAEDNRRNDLEQGNRYTLAVGIDHALTARMGGGFQIHGSRDNAKDPGYANTSVGLNTYLYRELGRTSAVLNLGYRRLEADERLFLYPERRTDNNVNASVSGTFRALTFWTFAPLVRVGYERNWSTIEIYDFDRVYAEFGLVAAF